MAETLVAMYDDFNTARDVVEDLVEIGFDRNNISIVANDTTGEYGRTLRDQNNMDVTSVEDVKAGEGAGFGAVVGTLVGLGAAVIPGVGPVLAAGPAWAALFAGIGAATGAVTGGAAAALIDLGIPEDEAGYYLEGVRRGSTLVLVAANTDLEETRARDVINRHNPVDVHTRGSQYRDAGWTGYDVNAGPYTTDQIREERNRYGGTR